MVVVESRAAWAEIDLWALRANVAALTAHVAPAALLAVVKANAYGHGAVPVARAALDAGATRLGVALLEEAQELRDAGITAPILLMSEPHPSVATTTVALRVTPVVYTIAGVEALAKAVVELDAPRPFPVHLKIDTGMHRVGCAPANALGVAEAIAAFDELELAGVCTHLATADTPGNPRIEVQLETFRATRRELQTAGHHGGIVHIANTAAALAIPDARADMVRTGIGIYGITPLAQHNVALTPVMSLKARVSHVHEAPAGASVSYGDHYVTERATRIATVPIGYADGVPRALGLRGGTVLIGGVRYPIAGVVTMDQLMVDCGDGRVEVGDEVVLIGQQGDDSITAAEWAELMDTIPYEIVCGIGSRVPRRVRG